MSLQTGVYVHLPFCPYICPYCDFAKWPYRRTLARRYFRALEVEIACAGKTFVDDEPRRFETVFLGGGTPNAYDRGDISELLDRLRTWFPGSPDRETTIEINPELVREGDLAAYRRAGVTRLSVGAQSFEPSEIATLGRRHTAADVQQVLASAKAAGFTSINVDLMFAVPGQTPASWRRSLESAIRAGADHVSAYNLTVEEGTPYERWRGRDPQAFFDDEREAELFEIAIETLTAAGYEQYEISNFARAGHRSAHNAHYWQNGDYVGLGVGAASYLHGERSVHTRDLRAYVDAAQSGGAIPGESERLVGSQRTGEAIMLALRTSQGVSLDGFKDRYGVNVLHYYAPVVERYREEGLLEVDATHVRLTRRGRFVANDVCAAFVTFA